MTSETIWLVVGFTGQALFSMRFLLQWVKSEKAKRSIIPLEFWLFSLAGGATLLSYAVYKQDPVFIVGQLGGLFIYSRNLYFVLRDRDRLAQALQKDQGLE